MPHLKGLIRRTKHRGFIPENGPSCESLKLQEDKTPLQATIRNPDHVLRHLCRERPALYTVCLTTCVLGLIHSPFPPETKRAFSPDSSCIMTSTNNLFYPNTGPGF